MDRLFLKNLQDLSYKDILHFLETSPSEDVRLDYKREQSTNDRGRKDLAKDVSAFANSQGGHMIIGVAEDENHLPELPPCGTETHIGNQPSKEWISQVINSNIARRPQYDIASIPFPDDEEKCIIIIRVPQSNQAPHMVTADGDNRYYRRIFKRDKYEARPAQEYEVREMYERSRRMSEYVEDYLQKQGYGDPDNIGFGENEYTSLLSTNYGQLKRGRDIIEPNWTSIVICPTYLQESIDVTSEQFDKWFRSDIELPPSYQNCNNFIPHKREVTFEGVQYLSIDGNRYVRLHRNGFLEFANSLLHYQASGSVTVFKWITLANFLRLALIYVQSFYRYSDISYHIRVILALHETNETVLATPRLIKQPFSQDVGSG